MISIHNFLNKYINSTLLLCIAGPCMCVSANKTSSRPHWTDSAAAARKAEKCLIRKKLSSPAGKTIEYPYICILIWYFKLFLPVTKFYHFFLVFGSVSSKNLNWYHSFKSDSKCLLHYSVLTRRVVCLTAALHSRAFQPRKWWHARPQADEQ